MHLLFELAEVWKSPCLMLEMGEFASSRRGKMLLNCNWRRTVGEIDPYLCFRGRGVAG